MTQVRQLVHDVERWLGMLRDAAGAPGDDEARASLIELLLILHLCQARGLAPKIFDAFGAQDDEPGRARAQDGPGRVRALGAALGEHIGSQRVVELSAAAWSVTEPVLRAIIAELRAHERLPAEALGYVYEHLIGLRANPSSRSRARKFFGIYYTPPEVTRDLCQAAVGPRWDELARSGAGPPRVVDPACGGGAFLLAAFDLMCARAAEHTAAARLDLLSRAIYGVDRDPHAVAIARLALYLKALEIAENSLAPDAPGVDAACRNLRCGDSLVAPGATPAGEPALAPRPFDWAVEFAGPMERGFDVVIGNPPWGQKHIVATDALKQYVQARFPSSRGIFDWFRPFVELAIQLARPGGSVGLVLPDIVLLKNYQATRACLLDHLAMTEIRWLGMAFPAASIDAVTIAGDKTAWGEQHEVRVIVHDRAAPLDHAIPQHQFRANPRATFNLYLTADRRRLLGHLRQFPRLGARFAIHEGVHSGNIRRDLFVAEKLDDTCHELLFGRDELAPFQLRWRGGFIRLSALPARRTRDRYANLGRPEWHVNDKVVVRRTGDRVIAAVDRTGRYVSNNFFVIAPIGEDALTLDGLCAALNSRFMTWLFRVVEPRKGRAFAELKIKHLVEFPLPPPDDARVHTLNELGRALATHDERRDPSLATHDERRDPSLALGQALDALIEDIFDVMYRPEGGYITRA